MLGPLKLKCKKMVSFGALSILLTTIPLVVRDHNNRALHKFCGNPAFEVPDAKNVAVNINFTTVLK